MKLSKDNQLNLILGLPLHVSNSDLKVEQYTIREIASIGYTKYLNLVGLILTTVDEHLKLLIDEPVYMDLYMQKHELHSLDFLMSFSAGNDEYMKAFQNSLEFVLGLKEGQIVIEPFSNRILYKNDLSDDDVKLIDKELFDEIVSLVEISNGIKTEVDDSNPIDERARKILEKMKKNRERVRQIKEAEGEEAPRQLHDIISAVTVKSPSTNKLTILDYTVFQVYDEYARLYTIDNYDLSVQSMLFGGTEISDWAEPH